MRVQLLVPINTPIATPVTTLVQWTGGQIIHRMSVGIPKGHAYLTGLQVFAFARAIRIIPELDSNADWLVDDNRLIERTLNLQTDAPQYSLQFRGYNLDDTYAHTFYIDIE